MIFKDDLPKIQANEIVKIVLKFTPKSNLHILNR